MINELGKLIKKYRKENELTQFEFAGLVGISEYYVGAIERGSKVPGRDTLIKLSNQLDVPIEQLLNYESNYESNYELKIESDIIYTEICSLNSQQKEFVLDSLKRMTSFFKNQNDEKK